MPRRNYRFKEDELIREASRAIADVHGFNTWRTEQHLIIEGKEIDAMLYWRTPHGIERRAVVELKDNKVEKVAEQILARRHLAHYAYMVVNLKPHVAMGVLLNNPNLLRKLWFVGVGLVAFRDEDDAVVVFKSRMVHPAIRQQFLTDILERLGSEG